MKKRAIATSAIAALLVIGAVSTAFALSMNLATGSSGTTSTTMTSHAGGHEDDHEHHDNHGDHFNLTAGQTLTFSNLNGHWVAFGHTEGEDDNEETGPAMGVKSGNSTGSVTFAVSGHSDEGYALTITSGSFTINGTTYTVTGGHVTLNEGGESGCGNGTASGGATFEIHVGGIHGNSTTKAQLGAVRLDVHVGKSGYLVILGSHEGVEDNEIDTD